MLWPLTFLPHSLSHKNKSPKALHLKSMPYTDKSVKSNGAVSGMSNWLWHFVCGWGSSIAVLSWLFTKKNEGKACVWWGRMFYCFKHICTQSILQNYTWITLTWTDVRSLHFQVFFICHLTKQQLSVPTLGCCCVCDRWCTVGHSIDRVGNCSGTVSEKWFHFIVPWFQSNVMRKPYDCKPAVEFSGCTVIF